MAERHLITSEYPPQIGGVSDYTHLVASGLAAGGNEIHVWCPPSDGERPHEPGVSVYPELGSMAPTDLSRCQRILNQFRPPRLLLVQWVPHGYGYRSMNIAFCMWLWRRATLNGDDVQIMVHEPYLAFGEGTWRQDAAATVHRLMTMILLRSASHVWVSIPSWERCWRPYALGRSIPFKWLPVPSNVSVVHAPAAVSTIRNRHLPRGGLLIGHFGAYGEYSARALAAVLPILLDDHDNRAVLLLGRGSELVRKKLILKFPILANKIHATGMLDSTHLSKYLSACDLMIQPYPDGVSSRRGTTMAGLAHGLPIITTAGRLTEPFWLESRAVSLAPADDLQAISTAANELLECETERTRISAAARELYDCRFDIRHTIAALCHASAR